MHPKYEKLKLNIEADLAKSSAIMRLPGIAKPQSLQTLAMQMVESERKQDRTRRFARRQPSVDRLSPGLETFDPEFAAVASHLAGDLDEACWLVFLSVHFGRHADDGWDLCRQIYGGFGPSAMWTWARVSHDPNQFQSWLNSALQSRNMPMPRFGNHRKYESINSSRIGIPAVFESYIKWVQGHGDHAGLIDDAAQGGKNDPKAAFSILYNSMADVLRFGRLGRFDYLTMLSKLNLAPIEADSTYLAQATGPKKGARLLFYGDRDANASNIMLEKNVSKLAEILNLGMQTMEDSLCNWQKSPDRFIAFRG